MLTQVLSAPETTTCTARAAVTTLPEITARPQALPEITARPQAHALPNTSRLPEPTADAASSCSAFTLTPELPESMAVPEANSTIWPLHSVRSGVPLSLLLSLNARGYINCDPLATVRFALAVVLGLNFELNAQGELWPEQYESYQEAERMVEHQARLLLLPPHGGDFTAQCHEQIALRLAQWTPEEQATWRAQFSPEVQARMARYPVAQLLLLAAHQWQLTLARRRSHRRVLSSKPLGSSSLAPWGLHHGPGLNLLAAAEQPEQPNPLRARKLRRELQGLCQRYLRCEQLITQHGRALLPNPIITCWGQSYGIAPCTVRDFELAPSLERELNAFDQHLERLSCALDLRLNYFFADSNQIASDRAWSSALKHKWRLVQCYDFCVRICAARHLDSPLAQQVQQTSAAIAKRGYYYVARHPISVEPQACSRRVLLAPVPTVLLDCLALASYAHALDAYETYQDEALSALQAA